MPSKSPHRGLLPIDPTIETRLRVNIEFVYHVASCHYVERVSSAPIQLSIAYDRGPLAILGGGCGQQYADAHVNEYLVRKNIIENVKKYVGEFY